MADTLKQDETAALVHWTYSHDEWQNFMRWKKKKKGFFHYLFHRLFAKTKSKTPDIKITEDKVSIDDMHESFHNKERQLQRVNIHDAGKMNIMEIAYHWPGQKEKLPAAIRIPVPKGKLKEAIQVQERLSNIVGRPE
jgi:hypothetical protein